MSDLLTVAEASGFRRTSSHREVVDFLARLAERTDLVKVESMGRSGEGQDMPVAILSASKAFTHDAARARDLPVVLVVANIHAGEVEGKEASLALARDATLGDRRHLIEKATVVVVPDYNPDGNDRIDPKNRVLDLARLEGQIGPEGGVGTRTTAAGVNLNRDYVKQEAVETRNLAALMARWRPHLVVDCHTTDGSIHGYELTYDTSRNLASCPPGTAMFVRDVLLPEVTERVRGRTGYRTWFYGNFVDQQDPTKGWESYPPQARYGSHYRGLLGAMDVLLEAYSYVDFETRFRVMYAFLEELVSAVSRRGPEILGVVRRGHDLVPDGVGRPFGIDYGTAVRSSDGSLSFRHEAKPFGEHDVEAWDLDSQRAHRVPGKERRTYHAPFLGRYDPTVTVVAPWAYVVPAGRTNAIERLQGHHLGIHRIEGKSLRRPVEAYRVTSREATKSPDIGKAAPSETVLSVEPCREEVDLSGPWALVFTTQPWGNVAKVLLEPHSEDGLARWGLFDDVAAGSVFPVRRLVDPDPSLSGYLRPFPS